MSGQNWTTFVGEFLDRALDRQFITRLQSVDVSGCEAIVVFLDKEG